MTYVTNKKGFIQAPAFSKSGAGFTLIEILIVLTLIGILSTFMLANFGMIKKARDTKRQADLKEIEKSLEQYRSDSGSYPSDPTTGIVSLSNCPNSSFGNPACSTIYLNKIPTDPNGSDYWYGGNYFYYSLDGNTYFLTACAEDSSDKDVLIESNLEIKIESLFGVSGKEALMVTEDFANSCASNYGYLITNQ